MYCNRADLVARFGESAITDLEYGNANAVVEAIADTTALIDGYVGSRYTLPLAGVPAIITRVARDLVFYNLNTDPSDNVKARRDEAMSYLKDLAQGKVALGVSQAAEPDSLDTAEIQSDGRVFSRANSRDFI